MAQYYYTDGKERFGPFTLEELKERQIEGHTLVWKEGLVDWVPASTLAELNVLLAGSSPYPPPVNMPYQRPLAEVPPKNWLVESILVTILCCLPLGIVGIIYSTKVDTLWKTGHQEEALKASKEAGKWVKLGAIIGFVVIVLYLILFFMGLVAGFSSGMEV